MGIMQFFTFYTIHLPKTVGAIIIRSRRFFHFFTTEIFKTDIVVQTRDVHATARFSTLGRRAIYGVNVNGRIHLCGPRSEHAAKTENTDRAAARRQSIDKEPPNGDRRYLSETLKLDRAGSGIEFHGLFTILSIY